jgi:hypothetical protein
MDMTTAEDKRRYETRRDAAFAHGRCSMFVVRLCSKRKIKRALERYVTLC